MRCPACEDDNRDGARFCNNCGAPLPVRCPGCGTDNRPGAKFCDDCGAPLTTAATARRGPSGERSGLGAPQAGSQRPTPMAYTPTHLAEKILASRAALEGERKQVTVLFADLKGSMELLADRDPEEARQLLDPVLERMKITPCGPAMPRSPCRPQ